MTEDNKGEGPKASAGVDVHIDTEAFKATQEALKKSEEARTKAEGSLKKLRGLMRDFTKRHKVVENERDQLKKRLDTCDEEKKNIADEANRKLEKTKKELEDNFQKERDDWERKKKTLSDAIGKQNTRINDLENENKGYRGKNSQLAVAAIVLTAILLVAFIFGGAYIVELNKKYDDAKKQITNLNNLNAALQNAVKEKDAIIAEKNAIIANKTATIAEKDAMIARLTANVAQLTANITRLTANLRELRAYIEELELDNEALTIENENLTIEIEGYLLSIEDLEDEIDGLNGEIDYWMSMYYSCSNKPSPAFTLTITEPANGAYVGTTVHLAGTFTGTPPVSNYDFWGVHSPNDTSLHWPHGQLIFYVDGTWEMSGFVYPAPGKTCEIYVLRVTPTVSQMYQAGLDNHTYPGYEMQSGMTILASIIVHVEPC